MSQIRSILSKLISKDRLKTSVAMSNIKSAALKDTGVGVHISMGKITIIGTEEEVQAADKLVGLTDKVAKIKVSHGMSCWLHGARNERKRELETRTETSVHWEQVCG